MGASIYAADVCANNKERNDGGNMRERREKRLKARWVGSGHWRVTCPPFILSRPFSLSLCSFRLPSPSLVLSLSLLFVSGQLGLLNANAVFFIMVFIVHSLIDLLGSGWQLTHETCRVGLLVISR